MKYKLFEIKDANPKTKNVFVVEMVIACLRETVY